jgi:hypothetical protein
MKCNETLGKWCKNKHGASKIIDKFETYQAFAVHSMVSLPCVALCRVFFAVFAVRPVVAVRGSSVARQCLVAWQLPFFR